MTRPVWFLWLILVVLPTLTGCGSRLHSAEPAQLAPAPRVVGVPPANAGAGLIRVSDTEIRHYNLNRRQNRGLDGDQPFGYTVSHDNGQTWSTDITPAPEAIADARHLSQDPRTGAYYALAEGGKWIAKAKSLEGPWQVTPIAYFEDNWGIIHDIVYPEGTDRLVFAVHDVTNGTYTMVSDDDGATWTRSNFVTTPPHEKGGVHEGVRWNHNAAESKMVQLRDGRLWMIIRCAQDHHFEAFSDDNGTTWSESRPSRFHGTITMSCLNRLDDGRLVMVWNSTTPLPELARATGWPEDVFTNREALHIAVSNDDGQTWRGFREVYLDPRRNARDWAETGGSDRGTQQNQFIDLRDNTVLVALGQHGLHRKFVIVDLDWVTATGRTSSLHDDNGDGAPDDWSTHQYLPEIRGHCSYNRKPGAQLEPHPDDPARQVLRIARPTDPELLCENQGAVWNFPAAHAGELHLSIMLPEGSQGAQINLLDHWYNPTDLSADQFAMASITIAGDGAIQGTDATLTPGEWYRLIIRWEQARGDTPARYRLAVSHEDNYTADFELPPGTPTRNGISYVQIISRAETTDDRGILVECAVAIGRD